jgi:hypothetical protein
MAITIDHVEALRRHLAELPRNQPKEVTKQEAITLLSTELGAARRRGYSPEELARLLSENGITINVATLRGYLRNRRSRKRPQGKTTPPVAGTAASERKQSAVPATTSLPPAMSARSTAVGANEQAGGGAKGPPESRGVKDAAAPTR